jgi:glycosyltransferase involved in cell wall biosynthesis
MHKQKRLAFIKAGGFSNINDHVLHILHSNFPDYHIEVIDIMDDLLDRKDSLALYHCFRQYGLSILIGRKSFSRSFHKTAYVFNKIRQILLKKLNHQNYTFTFQTQSLFDASVPGIPHFVYTDHTHLANLRYPGFNQRHLLNKAWLGCESEIYKNATLNFTMSSNISRSIINDYSCDPGKVVCVYCGPSIHVAQNEIFNDDRYAKKNILFVGLDWKRKGGPAVVNAFETVLITYPDATLTIVGCRPDLDLPNISVVGKISLPEVKKYYEQASIFCLPTNIEPFGIAFLEAMAHKLPLIGTNIGAIPEFIQEGKNGYLVESNDVLQLSQCIIKLIGSPERCREFGIYGHNLLWESYSWEKTGSSIKQSILKYIS